MTLELLTPDQAGKILGMSTHSLAQMRYLGNGPVYIKISAKTIRYRRSDLESWIDAHSQRSTRAAAG